MRIAEKYLDDFWMGFEDALVSKIGKTLPQLVGDRVKQQQILRTPPWVEPSLEEQDRDPENPPIEGLSLQSAFSNGVEYTRKKDIQESPRRTKVKTRGEPSAPIPADLQEDTSPPTSDAESSPEKIPVSNKDFKAFSALFRRPATTEESAAAGGELPWKNFVHAMTHIGFTAQHLDGSAWVFAKVPGVGRILIHEPHPESKIAPHVGRRIARRLQRNFGWEGGTFVVARSSEGVVEEN